MRPTLGEEHSSWHWIIGRSDARDQFVLLYHDDRGVLRVFDMAFADGQWTFVREDPDFSSALPRDRGVTPHQRSLGGLG